MTISYSGGTGSPAASAQGSTSISIAYPAFVAAGRIALLYATVKLSSATFNTTISGWTFIGEQAGGTGTSANDAGTTKIAAWYRVLDGTESGSVTVTNTGGVSSAGAMDIYQGTVGGWATPEFVGGADTSHDTAWSVTGGTWSSALAVDDWITLPMSTDTDISQSITSRALTQTGITFAGNFFRSRSLSTTGTDCGLYTFDWRVTAGSNTNAPTNVHTSGTNNCGAQLFIRLREQAAGVSGSGAGAFTFSGTAAGTPTTPGSGAGAFSFTATASGTPEVFGAATGAYSFTGTATGAPETFGTAQASLSFTGAASGVPDVQGTAAAALAFTGAASGVVEGAVSGTGLGAYTFTGQAAGTPDVHGAATASLTFGGVAFGVRVGFGQAITSITFDGTATGTHVIAGQGAAALMFTGAASGAGSGDIIPDPYPHHDVYRESSTRSVLGAATHDVYRETSHAVYQDATHDIYREGT